MNAKRGTSYPELHLLAGEVVRVRSEEIDLIARCYQQWSVMNTRWIPRKGPR
jgi:hypothetical protein